MVKIQLLFKGIYHGLGKFGKIISTIVNFILLLVVFIFGIGLVSSISKLKGKKFLELNTNNCLTTYWSDSPVEKSKKEDYLIAF